MLPPQTWLNLSVLPQLLQKQMNMQPVIVILTNYIEQHEGLSAVYSYPSNNLLLSNNRVEAFPDFLSRMVEFCKISQHLR